MILENQINYLVIILSVVLISLIILFKPVVETNQIYITLILLAIIIISTIYTIVLKNENFTNRICYNRNKEYLDYKDKIYNRTKELINIEEMNRESLVYDDEMDKVIEMGNLNLDYLANGETF